jgi:hypothetical protein
LRAITGRVPPDVLAVVERVAEREKSTVSQIVHRIVDAWAKSVVKAETRQQRAAPLTRNGPA